MPMWNPWRGCKRCSEGCKYCYIHKGDYKRNVDTSDIKKTPNFDAPITRLNNGNYKMKSGIVYTCFSTDFFIEEADVWREECWKMIKERSDLNFLFLTKRIERFMDCIPDDWEDGYDNIIIGCSVENQKNIDIKIKILNEVPIRHKMIICQPLIEKVDIEKYLEGIELVIVGGESDFNARPLDYDWVLDIREQCIRKGVNFEFRQCGTHFIEDNVMKYLKTSQLTKIAREKNINVTN